MDTVLLGDDVRVCTNRHGCQNDRGVSPDTIQCKNVGNQRERKYWVDHTLQRCDPQRFAQIRIDLVEGFSGYIYDRFLRNELTICLLHNLPGRSDFIVEQVGEERLYLVGAPKTARSGQIASDGNNWVKAPLILPSRTHSLRVLLESAARGRGVDLDVRYQVDGLSITKELIAHGLAMSVLGFNSIEHELRSGRLTAVPLRNPSLMWTLGLAVRFEQQRLPSVQAVLQAIRIALAAPGSR